MEYYNGGCLLCGAKRNREDDKKYDLYCKDNTSKSLVRVGLCETCFAGEIDLGIVKSQLVGSEIKFRQKAGKELIDDNMKRINAMDFVGKKGYEKFWDDIKIKYPDVAVINLTNDQLLENIENESQ